ncbi:MAG: rRNA maturation RNase YbeY [Planctomycetota bacterium]|nr:rRNA maturation RNase YbeY [Planctomycetota bacterium]
MSATVELAVQVTRVPGGRRRLERDLRALARQAADRAGRPVELSFAVIDDESMQALNREALDHDYPTDVLSFPYAEEPAVVGEVVLSADTARREAAARGHPAYHELLLYAVHGVLHLLGYDDHDPAARRRMRRAERAVLASLGMPPVFGRRRAQR